MCIEGPPASSVVYLYIAIIIISININATVLLQAIKKFNNTANLEKYHYGVELIALVVYF